MDARARSLIEELRLEPHPEGGFFREIFRSSSRVQPADSRSRRSALTTIYFLLPSGAHSRWHRVASDEIWHLYEGSVELLIADPELRAVQRIALRPASRNEGPVCTVPAGWWQAARPIDAYALTGCTVGPGFEFEDFSFLRDDSALAARLHIIDPDAAFLL